MNPFSFEMTKMNRFLLRVSLVVFVLIFMVGKRSFGQSIQFESIPTGPYGQGSSISVLFKPVGVFPIGNTFELWLSDKNGNCSNSGIQKIGIYKSHYTTFINGIIPTSAVASTNYKLKIIARDSITNNAVVQDSTSYTIEVRGQNGISGNFIDIQKLGSPVKDKWLWVSCNGITKSVDVQNNLNLNISSLVKNEFDTTALYLSDIPRTFNISVNQSTNISIPNTTHYRFFNSVTDVNGILSTQTWYLLNNKTAVPYSSISSIICYTPTKGGISQFVVGIDRTKLPSAYYNFPGYTYLFKWDDGTQNTVSTIQNIDSKTGIVEHTYSSPSSSCLSTITTNGQSYYNSIGPSITINQYNPPCNSPVSNIAVIEVFQKPVIKFTGPDKACFGSNVNFINTSDLGSQGNNSTNGCVIPGITYQWKVDGKVVTNSTDYKTSNLAVGSHNITLSPIYDANNISCSPDDYTQSICIQPTLNPSFQLNGVDSIVSCSPVPVKITNNTSSVSCSANSYKWTVLDSANNVIDINKGIYTISPSATDAQPTFSFTAAGNYYIKLTASNSCNPTGVSLTRKVNFNGGFPPTLKPDISYCLPTANKTIDFATDPKHKPNNIAIGAGDIYTWAISGGGFSYVTGDQSSAFPKIQFTAFATYTVSLTYKNNCLASPITVTQHITISQSPSITLGNDTTICYNTTSLPVSASITGGSVLSGAWTVLNGDGVFTDNNNANTTYTFGLKDKKNKVDTLVYTVKTSSAACQSISLNQIVTILPENKIPKLSQDTICSGSNLSLKLTSSTIGSSFNWVTPVVAGISGNLSNSGLSITDILVNNTVNPLEGIYIITPQKDKCTGSTDTFHVWVFPQLSESANPQKDSITICGFKQNNTGTYKLIAKDTLSAQQTGKWSVLSQPGITGVFSDFSKSITDFNYGNSGIYKLQWTIGNSAGCGGIKDFITLFVNDLPLITKPLTIPSKVCAGNSASISIDPTGIYGQIKKWQLKRPDTASMWKDTLINTSNIVFNGVQESFRIKLIVVSKDTVKCGSDSVFIDTLIQVTASASAGVSTGDTTVFSGANTGTVTLNGNSLPATWQTSLDGINFNNLPNTGQQITYTNLTKDTWYRAVVSSTCGLSYSNIVKVAIQVLGNNKITDPLNKFETSICINTNPPISILGTTPTGGTNYSYQWQSCNDTTNKSWITINGAITKDYSPSNVIITTFYRRVVTSSLGSGNLSDNSNTYAVFVRPNAIASWNILSDSVCSSIGVDASSIQLITDNSINKEYKWYADNSLFATTTNSVPMYKSSGWDSVLISMTAISKFGCKDSSLNIWFYTFPHPDASFTISDSIGCSPLPIIISNTTLLKSQFKYNWDFGNGVVSNLVNPGTIIFKSNDTSAKDTSYTIKLTAFSNCDTSNFNKSLRVRAKPRAILIPTKTFACSPLIDTFYNFSKGDSIKGYIWQFGDGSSIASNDSLPVTHTYHTGAQDTFSVKLIANNYCGNDTGQYAIVVAKSTIDLRITVNGNELTNCRNSHVHFINTTKGASTFNWDFGDGNHATTFGNAGGLDTVIHQYDTVGTFKITYQASNNCTDTTGNIIIKVLSTPNAAFIATPDTVCIGHPISFTNKSDATTGLVWSFGDGKGSLLTNPSHSYANAGDDTVQLIAVRQHTSANICRDTAIRQVTIVPSLPGYIKASDSVSVCVPFTVTFTNTFAASTKLCSWNFDDGSKTTGNVVTHTFTKVGVYNVSMSAVDTGGCNYIANKQITVNGPAGFYVYDHGIICSKVPVKLEATVTGTDSLRWNMGNGEFVTTLPNIPLDYLYPQSGKFVPSVTLISAGGKCKVKLNALDTITIDKVEAGFSVNQLRVCDKTTASFVDTSRAYLGLNSWFWNFGDSKTSTFQNPTHNYLTTNDWATQLIVKSKSGCSDTANLPTYIKINNTPQASILVDTIGCVMQAVLYNAVVTSIDSATYFSWKFSNGTAANTSTANAYYSLAGSYTAKLIVGTAFGCYDTASIATVKIYPTPQVVTNPDFQLCKGQTAFVNTTGAATYQWTPSLGLSCNTCYNPIANPITTTRYVVAGYNKYGCAGRDTMIVTVIQPFKLITSGNDTMCIGDAAHQLIVSGASNYKWFPPTGLSATNIATPLANPPITTDYRIIGNDNYHCFADTAHLVVAVGTYPSVTLGPDLVLSTGTKVTMMPMFTFPTQTAGPIGKYVWTPSTYLSCDDCENPVATVEKDICYTLSATNIYGCSANTDTLCIKAFCKETQVFIANAFTPDGDGVNDLLVVQGKGIRVINSFRVFNRWGQVVFEQTNFQPNDKAFGWDGKIKGVPAAADVYVYTCQIVCENDVAFVYKGNTSVIR